MVLGDKEYDRDVAVSGDNIIAFEWCFESAQSGVRRDVVTPRANNAARRGVPTPGCICPTPTFALVDLKHQAIKAAAGAKEHLQEYLGCSDLAVTCSYIGIVGAGGVDINADCLQHSTAAFEWTLQAPEFEWQQEVRERVDHCIARHVPLPPCTVNHVRLQDVARTTGQAVSNEFGLEIRCVYPAIIS